MEPLIWKFGETVKDLVCGWPVEVQCVRVQDTGLAFARLQALGTSLGEQHRGTLIGDIDGIGEARRLYRSFGVDPTRTRPSSEALLRRCMKGQALYRISEAVDVGNWVSLEFLLPLGLYDRAKIEGPIATVRRGLSSEEYEGIRKGPVHVGSRLCVSDTSGAFGSPTSDSLRTSVSAATTDIAAIVFAPVDGDPARLAAAGHALATRLAEFGQGSVVTDGPAIP